MPKRSRDKSKWQRVRKFFNDIHLWLGLTSGLIVVAVCFSGTVYVFNTELTEWAAPHLYKVKPVAGSERIPADLLITKIEISTGGSITSIAILADAKRAYHFSVKKEGDSLNRGGTC